MHLVDPKMMMMQPPVTAPVNPIHHSIATLDSDMRGVLERHDLNDEEKVRQYNQILHRYLEYHDHLRTPSLLTESNTVKEAEIIRTVPVKYRGKAESLLKRIEREPSMRWNERGEFVHNGQVIKGSNIVDLVNDVVRHRKDFHPHGWQEFARALRRGNVPQDLVGNRRRWDWMHRESATSDAFSTAEEDSPERTPRSRPRHKTPAYRQRSMSKITNRAPLTLKKWEPLP